MPPHCPVFAISIQNDLYILQGVFTDRVRGARPYNVFSRPILTNLIFSQTGRCLKLNATTSYYSTVGALKLAFFLFPELLALKYCYFPRLCSSLTLHVYIFLLQNKTQTEQSSDFSAPKKKAQVNGVEKVWNFV